MGASVSYDRTTSQGQVVMDPALVDDMIRRLSEARLASLQGKQVHLSFSYTNPCFPKLSYAICCKVTNYFSSENKIDVGVCGVVYRGKLIDGREVAVARSETAPSRKNKVEENEAAIDSVLAVLSRPHHKNLVTFVGLCEEDERYLVYEYTKHGALYDRLQGSSSSELNSWKMRIKIAVDAARGIEYLHNYAVPPIIHGHIRSSYILLDENWTARVSTRHFGLSDFGLSWECGVKSDVYGLGVVLTGPDPKSL